MTQLAAATVSSDRAQQIRQTRQALDTIDDTSLVNLTRLGVDGVRALKQEVAEIFPASNLPAFLLQGLIQLEDRALQQVRYVRASLAEASDEVDLDAVQGAQRGRPRLEMQPCRS